MDSVEVKGSCIRLGAGGVQVRCHPLRVPVPQRLLLRHQARGELRHAHW